MHFTEDPLAHEATALAEINMVPFIDIMLVLLVVFLVAAPMLTQAVKVQLPQATSHAEAPLTAPINISVNGAGTLYWNDQAVDRSTLQRKLHEAAQASPAPALRLQADRNTPYEKVAQVMADAAHDGISQMTFVALAEPRQ